MIMMSNMNRLRAALFKRKKKDKITSKELWNLDVTIIEWLVPRLKAFREQTDGYPGDVTWDEWMSILDKIITGLEAYQAERTWDDNVSKEINMECDRIFYSNKNAEFQEAMRLLAKHFKSLWW